MLSSHLSRSFLTQFFTQSSYLDLLPLGVKQKNHPSCLEWFLLKLILVIPLGLEPRTLTLKVLCSTS